jgi:hypothetical protein
MRRHLVVVTRGTRRSRQSPVQSCLLLCFLLPNSFIEIQYGHDFNTKTTEYTIIHHRFIPRLRTTRPFSDPPINPCLFQTQSCKSRRPFSLQVDSFFCFCENCTPSIADTSTNDLQSLWRCYLRRLPRSRRRPCTKMPPAVRHQSLQLQGPLLMGHACQAIVSKQNLTRKFTPRRSAWSSQI